MIQMKNARCTFSSIEPATPYEEQVTPANLSTMCLTYCFSAHGGHKRSRARLCWRRSPPAWSFLQEWSSGSSWQGDGGGHYEFVAAVKRSPRLCHCAVGWGEGGDTTNRCGSNLILLRHLLGTFVYGILFLSSILF
jgi:hypothetical protein